MFNGYGERSQFRVHLSKIHGAVPSDRFMRLLNTFWTSSIAADFVRGTMPIFQFQNDAVLPEDYFGIHELADVQANLIYVGASGWLAFSYYQAAIIRRRIYVNVIVCHHTTISSACSGSVFQPVERCKGGSGL